MKGGSKTNLRAESLPSNKSEGKKGLPGGVSRQRFKGTEKTRARKNHAVKERSRREKSETSENVADDNLKQTTKVLLLK